MELSSESITSASEESPSADRGFAAFLRDCPPALAFETRTEIFRALVVADRLVSVEIRSLVAGELRVAGKAPGCAEKAQREIYDWCEEGVRAGRKVVRLKIGDPFVFGRGGEEIEALGQALAILSGMA